MPRVGLRSMTLSGLILLLAGAQAMAAESFAPITGWDRQLFASYLIATATVRLPEEDQVDTDDEGEFVLLGDRQGVLGVEVESPEDDTPITVKISASSILEESTFSGTLDTEGTVYRIFPRVRYKYNVLAR